MTDDINNPMGTPPIPGETPPVPPVPEPPIPSVPEPPVPEPAIPEVPDTPANDAGSCFHSFASPLNVICV